MSTKKISFILVSLFNLLFGISGAKAQQISPYIFGQNAWMPDSIGTKKFYGSLEKNWPAIQESGAKIMRYGGIGVDENRPKMSQYIKKVDEMRSRGMEPMLQVSFHKWQYTAAQAADIVRYVNITMGKNVKYWIIGNEPDLGYSYTTAAQVAAYIKQFATAMKAVDPTIKIVGPETAWYNHSIIAGLTTPGGPDDVTGRDQNGRFYVDIISFHAYPLLAGAASRSSVITNLTEKDKLQDNLTLLNSRIATCNSFHGRSGSTALQTAITEFNVNYQNPAGDNLYGTGTNSFIGGQYWAEALGIAMKKGVSIVNFWSVIEGNTNELNIGYLNRGDFAKKPAYYHFQMMSRNFSGNYADATDNQPNVKAFGSKNGSQVSVLVMNQDAGANMNYTVRLDNNTVSGSNALKVNVNAAIAKEYTGYIENQSTQVLIFDLAGNLVKKIEYKLNGHASAGLPPQESTFTAAAATVSATVSPASASICPGGNVVLKANTGTNYTYQWMKSGIAISGATASSYTVTAAGSYHVKVTQGTGSATSTAVNVTSASLTATISPGGATTVASGGSVLLKANTGTGYTYQWMKNGTAISGATTANYTATSSGSYQVKVVSGTCNATSAGVNVTVGSLTATVSPAGTATFCSGGSVTLTANTGSGYTYQWKKNGVAITGATASTYKVTSAGSYVVTVKSGTLASTSPAVSVTLANLTATVTPASSLAIAQGGSVILKSNTGTGYTYQWRKNSINISGATAATYTATTAGSYQVQITKGSCVAYSTPVTVTTSGSVTATITPMGSTTFTSGGSVKLQANTGTGYTYVWKKNGVIISGATASAYTATTAGSYVVVVKSGTATASSTSVLVTVSGSLQARITVGGSTTIPAGGNVMLYANTGTNYKYQWRKNGVSIPGATYATYKVTTAGSYQVKVTLLTANAYSSLVSITVGSSTAKVGDPDDATASEESNRPGAEKQEEGDNEESNRPGAVKSREGNEAVAGNRAGATKVNDGSETRSSVVKGNRPGATAVQAAATSSRPGATKAEVANEKSNRAGATKQTAMVNNSRPGAAMSETTADDATSITSEPAETAVTIGAHVFDVKVGPNPTAEQFGVTVTTGAAEPITLRIFDMHGRLCAEEKNMAPNETIRIGSSLASGQYIAHVEQGSKKEVIKLIKAN